MAETGSRHNCIGADVLLSLASSLHSIDNCLSPALSHKTEIASRAADPIRASIAKMLQKSSESQCPVPPDELDEDPEPEAPEEEELEPEPPAGGLPPVAFVACSV